MGNIFWNKSLSTKEQLEEIQNELDTIETFKLRRSVREKNIVVLLYFTSTITYMVGLVYLYFNMDRESPTLFKIYGTCFILLLPAMVFLVRNLLGIWYRWTIDSNNSRLIELLKMKKKILSKVQETETFNEARMILEKYDPQALRNMSMSLQNLSSIPSSARKPTPQFSALTPPRSRSHTRGVPPTPQQAIMPPSMGQMNQPPSTPMAARTVRPILPPERSVVEKVVDYMFSDGPEARFALICFQCRRHNGMALPDEFEYMSYCCAYCGVFNPARKVRPGAPIPQQMAIEGPNNPGPVVEEPSDSEGPKIEEIGTELNKTIQPDVSRRQSTSNLRKQGSTTSIFEDAKPDLPAPSTSKRNLNLPLKKAESTTLARSSVESFKDADS